MTQYSDSARRNLMATSADEPFLILLEITHADLEVPVRVVNDNQDITSNGSEFISCPFEITLPDDVGEQIPKAQISVDNIGRELTQWLEHSNGGAGAKCRIMQIMRSDPDLIEYDMTLDMSAMSITNETVSSELGFQSTLSQAAVAVRYDPGTSPGLW